MTSNISMIKLAGEQVTEGIERLFMIKDGIMRWSWTREETISIFKTMEFLAVRPLIQAYDNVARWHGVDAYSGETALEQMPAMELSPDHMLAEAAYISSVFKNSIQNMATDPELQALQRGTEKAALDRLLNLIRLARGA